MQGLFLPTPAANPNKCEGEEKMELHFTTMTGDQFGKKALSLLAKMGYATTVLKLGETAAAETITLFKIEREDIQSPIPEEFRTFKTSRGRNPYYLCCSAVRLQKVVPEWAQTSAYPVGILSIGDRKNGSFASALRTLTQMFQVWDWHSGKLVPWAEAESDPNIYNNPATLEKLKTWRESPAVRQLGQESEKDLEICRLIEGNLQSQGGYFVGEASQALQISPDFFWLNQHDLELCQRNVNLVVKFWQEILRVYDLAISNRDSELSWVADSIEGPITEFQRTWQRNIARGQNQTLPLFARVDLSSVWFPVEIQERIGGLGLVESWLKTIHQITGFEGIVSDANGFAPACTRAVKKATGKQNPVVVLVCPSGYEEEQKYLAKCLNEFGLLAFVINKEGLEEELEYRSGYIRLKQNGLHVDFLYRREMNAASLAESEIGEKIMWAVMSANLVVEPPLNMVFDCKTPMAWVHDRRLQALFSREVLEMITPTVLLPADPDQKFQLQGKTLCANGLVGQPYVIKYGGENIQYGFGGRAVFGTDDKGESLEYGLSQVRLGHPWIVQPLDKKSYLVRQWTRGTEKIEYKRGAGRIMLHLCLEPNGQEAKIITACAQIRPNHWKAAGNRESIFQEIRVR